eukprot:7317748-Lingulodinium_polyedra.AAC.1
MTGSGRSCDAGGLPDWATSVAEALVTDREVRPNIAGRRGRTRTLKRNVGMGGPPSTLVRNTGYDPIVEAIGGPTFVDDLG